MHSKKFNGILSSLSKIIPTRIYLKIRYKRTFNTKINFKNPQTLNEKLNWKKIYDKNPLYTKLADKYAVREYIQDKIGEKYLIPLLHQPDKPEEIPFDKLPLPYIIKPNHLSGDLIIIRDKKEINKKKIIEKCAHWLSSQIYYISREPQYKDISKKIVIEKLLLNRDGKVPADCRFFCFNGKVEFIQIDAGRFYNHERGIFDLNWKLLPFEWGPLVNGKPKYKTNKNILKPNNLKKMIRIARILSRDFDFIRVDLYSLGKKIYCGELTFHPGGGFSNFIPKKYDLIYGKKLKLKAYKKKSP